MDKVVFEWDHSKNEKNIAKHGVSFFDAQQAFLDPNRIIAEDLEHSRKLATIVSARLEKLS